MFGRTKNDFEEYEKELNKKMEEVLFSHDPYKGKLDSEYTFNHVFLICNQILSKMIRLKMI